MTQGLISAVGLSSLLSSISRKVKLIFGDNVHEISSSVLNLDLASLDAKEDHIQVRGLIRGGYFGCVQSFVPVPDIPRPSVAWE